ncbi:DNRLRE domain-containing protein [Streptomyces californicus]|uniref:DNRLRE domain-containing protein n=1 Tax=Streptomyces californicus TaxID=67351 RepID=UPI0036BEC9B9
MVLAVEMALVTQGGHAVALTQQAAKAPVEEKSAPEGPREAADILSAKVAARLSGKRVEALSERTETSTTWVNKDGSLTTELSSGPVRFEQDGSWTDVDVELRETAEGVEAKAHPNGLSLAGRGGRLPRSMAEADRAPARDLVTLGEGDERITLQWQGGLPAPELDGTRATYPEALPGADVIVEATRTGFEQYVEIKKRPAEGYTYTLPLKAEGLTAKEQPDGSVLFTDRKNKKRAVMPAPVMWDSTVDEVSGEHTRRVPVAMKVVEREDAVDLVVTPDAKFLADPETTYPVTVDPSTSSLSNVFDTYVQQGETRDWSTDVELDFGNPGTTNANGTPRTAQSFITWNTAPIADALVTSAKLSLWNFHSANTTCAAQPWQVWSSPAATTASRWTNRPTMTAMKAESTETRGNAACTAQPDGWINANVTTLAQEWASAKTTRGHLGIRAKSETTVAQWKRVNSANAAKNPPKLSVTYNYRPRTGTKQEAGPPFFSYGGAYMVNTVRPTLRDTFVDPNGDKIQGAYQIFDNATDTQVGDVLRSGFVPSGQPAPVTVPAGVLANGKTYKFRSSPYDGTHYNLGWSPWKTFTVDTTAPSAPAKIVSTDYPADKWVKGVGQTGTFTVTPPSGSDHNWLEWSLDGLTWTKVGTGGTATARAISVAPPKDGTHTLQVRAVDKADNKSEAIDYTFHAGPGGFIQPSESERTARRLPLVAEAEAAKYNAVAFSWRRSEADPWVRIPAGQVTSNGTPLTAWPVPMTNGRNAPLVWKATDTVDPDGTVQIKADFTGPNNATGSTAPLSVVVDRNASGASSQGVGPGQVNLLTGDYSLSASDASAFDLSVTRTATSRTPDKGATQEGQAPIFGKEWVTGTAAELTDSDWSHVRRITDTAVALIDSEGEETYFSANSSKTAWIPEPGAEDLVLKGAVTGSFTLNDSDGTLTTFTKPDATASTWQVSSTLLDGLTNSTTTVLSETTTMGGRKLARPKRIIAPTSAATAAACGADPTTKGCRVIEFVYAASTTATGGTFGDFSGQTKEIRLWSTAPGAASATSKSVQTYLYDAGGRLRQAWDPQITPSLKTEYAYDSAGRVTQLTPPGELPWTFTYGKAGDAATAGEGMLLKAARSGLKQGTVGTAEGTAATSVVYDVPLTGATAPFKMAAGDVKAWGQLDAPADAAAVFPSDAVPASHSGSSLAATAYKRANLHYLGVSGRQVNSISPGGYVTTTEYDHFGNTVRELSAANRAVALGLSAENKAVQADLGIAQLSSAERADLLATRSVHSEDGTRELEEFGPLRRVELTADLKSGSTLLVPSGTSVTSRPWKVNQYDAGRPSDGTANVKDQVTKVTIGGEVREHPGVMSETRATQTVFDWAKGLPTQTIQDPGGLALTTKTEYDAQGRVTKQLLPGANGTDAATRVTTYWSTAGTGACNGRPEWDGLVCTLAAGGAVTGGSGPTALPVTTTEYDWWGNPAKVTETAGSQTRTTTMSYDPAGRPLKTAVTGGLGQAVPETTTEYEPTNGRPGKIVSSTGGTLTKGYDRLGRLISYADADAGRTTTEYDLLDRPVKVTDTAPSTTVYTYDHTAEPGGMATSMTDSVAGTFGYAYDADGNIKEERLPGDYRLAIGTDTNGTAVSRVYTRSDGTMVYSDTVNSSVHGQTVGHAGWSEQNYRYDAAGRIATVEDTAETVCTRRAYTFDGRSNRKSLTTATGGPGADCPTSGGTATASTYDSADRLTNSGYTYDAFGRTLSLPGAGTVGYYANDLVHQQTANGKRQTWQLDAALRFRSWKVETGSGATWTQSASKLNHYGNDSDVPRWIVEDTATGALTRNVASATGQLQATTAKSGNIALQLVTVHGDVALQLPLDAAEAPVAMDYDEYGLPRATSAQGRYGWLGGAQRSGETVTGLTLMGVRLYNPETGRFLSVDPVYGGSANAYEYAMGDPVNGFDLDGKKAKKTTKWKRVSTYWVNGKWYNSTYSNMPRPLRAFFQGIMGRFMVGVYIDSMKWQGRWRHGKWTRYYKGKKQTKRGKVTTGYYNYADRSRITVCVPWVGCYTQTSAWNDGRWG